MKKLMLYIILFLHYLSIIFNTEVIEITGNDKTSNQIILNKINLKSKNNLNKDSINEIKQNLLAMEIFESVEVTNTKKKYIIHVKEKKLISYAPLIRKEDGIGWSVGPLINITNINGQGKNLYFSSSIGALKSGEIKYFNQKILLEYTYNIYNSIESDYKIDKNNLFISYIISKKKYTINITPQINNYNLRYDVNNILKKYRYFSFSYNSPNT